MLLAVSVLSVVALLSIVAVSWYVAFYNSGIEHTSVIFFQFTDQRKKNPKEPPSNRTKTLQTMDNRATTDRTPAPNSTYKKLAVQWLNEALCFVSSFVVADSLVLRNRQLLVAANR